MPKLPESLKNFSWAIAFWFIVCGILFVFTDSVVMPIVSGQLTSTVSTPMVEGLDSAAAEQALIAAGLGVIWREEGKYSTLIPEGKVLTQLPQANRVVKVGRNIRLTKSLGKRKVALPSLRGESLRQGEITLQRLGVVEGPVVKGYHATIPRGVIIRTIPQDGSMVRAGDTVSLVVSGGRVDGTTLLPSLTNTTLDDAKEKIKELGFELGEINTETSDKHIKNTVLDQYPKAGEYLLSETKINLIISQ